MIKRLFGFGVIMGIVVMIALVTYMSISYLNSPAGKPVLAPFQQLAARTPEDNIVIKPGTIVRREKKYACGDTLTEFQGPAPEKLQGLSNQELQNRYPPGEGWEVSRLSGGIVLLSKSEDTLCEKHENYRHLGLHRGMLAVYKGPLGYNKKLVSVERDISLESLPGEYREKLEKAMDFDRQDYSTRLELRSELEFPSEENLNTVLDTLDEYKR